MFVPGRQKTGYLKHTLFFTSFCDLHILKYPTGSSIPPHTDPIPGKKHYRLNIALPFTYKGGVFSATHVIFQLGRICFFRPDIAKHQVSTITSGTRYVLSFGFAL